MNKQLYEAVRNDFKSGERYTNKELKQLLQDRYN